MRAALLFGVLASAVALAQFGGSEPPLSSGQVLSVVQDAGTLSRANEDLRASTFVATGFSADGGTGGYAFTCNGPTCMYKLAEGSEWILTVQECEWLADATRNRQPRRHKITANQEQWLKEWTAFLDAAAKHGGATITLQ